jgi:hypothetical protein
MKKFKGALGISKKKSNKHTCFPSDDDSMAGNQRNHGSEANLLTKQAMRVRNKKHEFPFSQEMSVDGS